MAAEKVVLAYSGGLDTSVAIGWIAERTGADVIAVAVDARAEFAEIYCIGALHANALYMNKYPLVSALSRPLIVTHLARVAAEKGATVVAHGCTGKGNDQVRFEVGLAALAPELKVNAPVRDSGMTRDKAIEFAAAK